MHVDEYKTKVKAKRFKSWPTCISNIIKKFLDVLTDEALNIYFLFEMWTIKLRLLAWLPKVTEKTSLSMKLNLQVF
jgi:hypothetical protein